MKGSEDDSSLHEIKPPSGHVLGHIIQHKKDELERGALLCGLGSSLTATQLVATIFVHSVERGLHSLTFAFICLGVSVRKIEEVESLALIFVCAPCKAGKKTECSSAGLG